MRCGAGCAKRGFLPQVDFSPGRLRNVLPSRDRGPRQDLQREGREVSGETVTGIPVRGIQAAETISRSVYRTVRRDIEQAGDDNGGDGTVPLASVRRWNSTTGATRSLCDEIATGRYRMHRGNWTILAGLRIVVKCDLGDGCATGVPHRTVDGLEDFVLPAKRSPCVSSRRKKIRKSRDTDSRVRAATSHGTLDLDDHGGRWASSKLPPGRGAWTASSDSNTPVNGTGRSGSHHEAHCGTGRHSVGAGISYA